MLFFFYFYATIHINNFVKKFDWHLIVFIALHYNIHFGSFMWWINTVQILLRLVVVINQKGMMQRINISFSLFGEQTKSIKICFYLILNKISKYSCKNIRFPFHSLKHEENEQFHAALNAKWPVLVSSPFLRLEFFSLFLIWNNSKLLCSLHRSAIEFGELSKCWIETGIL